LSVSRFVSLGRIPHEPPLDATVPLAVPPDSTTREPPVKIVTPLARP